MAERTIFLKKSPLRVEGNAAGTITPGMTVTLGSGGTYTAGPAAAAAPAGLPLVVAMEPELWDGKNIDDNYVSGDRLLLGTPDSGAEWYALVAAAASANVIGDALEYGGGGYLRKATTGKVIAQALEAVDNSAGGTPARIIVRAV
jgi:hypothetical protein